MPLPVRVSGGAAWFGAAWVAGLGLATLTGSAAVVMMLAFSAVALGWCAIAGAVRPGRHLPVAARSSGAAQAGGTLPLRFEFGVPSSAAAAGAVRIGVRDDNGSWGWWDPQSETVSGVRRGEHRQITVEMWAAGRAQLVWWRRRRVLTLVSPIVVHPRAADGSDLLQMTAESDQPGGDSSAGAAGESFEGVRPWRDGDLLGRVSWAASLRSGELQVRDFRGGTAMWELHIDSTPSEETIAKAYGAALWAIGETGQVTVVVADSGPEQLGSIAEAQLWAARLNAGSAAGDGTDALEQFDERLTGRARGALAVASGLGVLSLSGVVGVPVMAQVALVVALVAGVVAWIRFSGRPPAWLRGMAVVGAVISLGVVMAGVGSASGIVELLRGPLAQLVIVLVALHGFELSAPRQLRFAVAVSGVLTAYAAALRVDDALIWWIAAWAVAACVALVSLRPEASGAAAPARMPATVAASGTHRLRASAGHVGVVSLIAVVGVAVLAVVAIPEGPARLALPTQLESSVEVGGGGLVAPDGSVVDNTEGSGGERNGAGGAGGYTGFAETLDTNVRGALSDDVVMRVRAPEPSFWRGQTFAEFDGRYWYASDEDPQPIPGPNILLNPAAGDVRTSGVEVTEFVQTYFLETATPNLVFAAYRPVRLALDADVYARRDGALRSSVRLDAGSIYTVVSARPEVTAESLRAQGDVAELLSESSSADGLADYLESPDSTTARTRILAWQLTRETTYDTVGAMIDWIGANTEYDLDAPIPAEGSDAVDDFLFESQRGFCEQIASSLVVMLRSVGVPARLAAGYVSGERDPVTQTFEVRGRDAHAWVEVWFPDSGWQAFDPTAAVPLAGEIDSGSVGAALIAGTLRTLEDNAAVLAGVAGSSGVALLGIWLVRRAQRRRRRGEWGLLQDRFDAVCDRVGAGVPGESNPARARQWGRYGVELGDAALDVAARLDRCAFDEHWAPDSADSIVMGRLLGELESGVRHSPHTQVVVATEA